MKQDNPYKYCTSSVTGNKMLIGNFKTPYLFVEDVQNIIECVFEFSNQYGLKGVKLYDLKIDHIQGNGFNIECKIESR